MMMRSLCLMISILGLLGLFTACGDDGSSTAGSCVSDLDCSRGYICLNDSCDQLACDGLGDCGTGQICISATNGDSYCSGLECDPTANTGCDPGESCADGLCLPGGVADPCDGVACLGTDTCLDGVCQPVGPGCTDDTQCAAGETCNVETGACAPAGTITTGEACAACEDATECPAGWSCSTIATGKACLPPCTSNNDCATGWSCQTVDPTAGSMACAPAGYKCQGCITDGCPAGQTCNTINGQCYAPQSTCGTCQYDWECGSNGACVKTSDGPRVCMERCSGGTACAADTTCQMDPDDAVEVCKGACEEAGLPCDGQCQGATPFCKNELCVQCTDDTHCSDGGTCDMNGFCTGCGGEQPYYWDGACVQCLEDSHCAEGTICNQQTHACGAEDDVCAQCSDPYPACASVGGEFYCVQCNQDSDCGLGGTCNTATYSCEGGTVTPTDACTSDADCDPGLTGYDLACDTGSGYCYDKNGGCDDVTAFCKGGGDCLDLLSALMGGGGGVPGGLPGMPGGGMTLPGLCPCSIPFLDPSCGDATCLPLGQILGTGSGTESYCFSL